MNGFRERTLKTNLKYARSVKAPIGIDHEFPKKRKEGLFPMQKIRQKNLSKIKTKLELELEQMSQSGFLNVILQLKKGDYNGRNVFG